jgi:zinc resistance-associated protein
MNRMIVSAVLGAALLSTAALAQERGDGPRRDLERGGMMSRFSPEDLEAFTDARIAALRAGLKLTPDQERMWPPVEEALRGLVNQRREAMRARREGTGPDREDLLGRLRAMAERQTARGEALRKLADAATPLFDSFDDAQKRRLHVLVRDMRPRWSMMREFRHRDGRYQDGWHHRWH